MTTTRMPKAKNNQKPTDATVSGGDSFDLADIGLAYAKYVRLTDIGDLKQEGQYAHLEEDFLPGIILLDLNMPRKDGRAALKATPVKS